MIFYLATSGNRRQLLTRKDEAAKIDPEYATLEIGADKESMQKALQELLTEADEAKASLGAKEPETAPEQAPRPTVPLSAQQKDIIYPEKRRATADIVDFIFDEADVHQVSEIIGALGTRVGELLKERRS